MKLQCWIYVTTDGLGGRPETIARVRELEARLQSLAAAMPGLGCSAAALLEPRDFEEEDIERELVESVSGGKLPAIVLNLTYDLERLSPGGEAIDAMLAEFGFRHAVTDQRDD